MLRFTDNIRFLAETRNKLEEISEWHRFIAEKAKSRRLLIKKKMEK